MKMIIVSFFLSFLFACIGPTVIAAARRHRNLLGIFLLNLFAGWTGVGWLAALIWSVAAGREKDSGGASSGIVALLVIMTIVAALYGTFGMYMVGVL